MHKNQIRSAILHALTQYDRRQSKRAGFNRHALPQYLARLDEIMTDIENGATPRAAITAGFTGRLADACLRAVHEPAAKPDEEPRGWFYVPAVEAASS